MPSSGVSITVPDPMFDNEAEDKKWRHRKTTSRQILVLGGTKQGHHLPLRWRQAFSQELVGRVWRRRDSHPGPKIHPRRNLRCVSASRISLPTSRCSEEPLEASSGQSRHRRPKPRVGDQPAELTSRSGPQADRRGRSQFLRLRERAACPQLGWFPSDLRG